MKVVQLVKYYDPSQGGMETVVKNIVEGIIDYSDDVFFTVYSNNHKIAFLRSVRKKNRELIIKEATFLLLRSQPLNLMYSSLKKLIKDSDVIHHHYPFPTMEFNLLRTLKKYQDKKFIITWHANIKNSRWSWIERFYNPMIVKLLDRADHIVVTSPQLVEASDILKKYSSKIKIIPLTFNPRYSVSEGRTFQGNKLFDLLFVGKLRKYKGVKYLLEAIKDLPVRLTIVGNGEELENLKEQAKFLDITDKITFVTNADDDELLEIYQKSDLFVLPSVNEAEAFGVVQLEAMSNGLPVINTRLNSGVPFVSLNDVTGLTVEPKNVEELKSAIKKITENKIMYETFSENAIDRAREFCREKMASSYLDLYRL